MYRVRAHLRIYPSSAGNWQNCTRQDSCSARARCAIDANANGLRQERGPGEGVGMAGAPAHSVPCRCPVFQLQCTAELRAHGCLVGRCNRSIGQLTLIIAQLPRACLRARPPGLLGGSHADGTLELSPCARIGNCDGGGGRPIDEAQQSCGPSWCSCAAQGVQRGDEAGGFEPLAGCQCDRRR